MFTCLQLKYLIGVFLLKSCIYTVFCDNNTCEGKPYNCCDGYMWDEDKHICEACNIGYFGSNCSEPCPSGIYGWNCQKRCNCSKETCSNVNGCRVENERINFTTHSKVSSMKKTSVSMNSFITFGISSLAIFSTVIFIIYIGMKVFQRFKKTDGPLEIEMKDINYEQGKPNGKI
ncbi:multiple epidermal growth factor-like domains protein 10 [Saccostrea cucullata]|uniref:multiple epidermal growth factor-like domains protein 10 n=1 Tax=Saccostrea cuccullata TaxID=36930 RepID=UPI002ED02549